MKFAYTYRSSDGQRHMAEVEAESRDAAFAKVRAELGIKPIKVTAAGETSRQDGASAHGRAGARPSRSSGDEPQSSILNLQSSILNLQSSIFLVAILAALVAIAWWWAGARDARPYQVMSPQGPVTLSVAAPLPRQAIPGDRRRIDDAVAQERDPPVFRFAAERWLARYAEPGRWSSEEGLAQTRSGASERPAPADFEAALREPIRIASTDFTEVVDLKRIVAGMKRELRAYLAGGGTVEQYLLELAKRQMLEVSYRENAEKRLEGMLAKPKDAYAYWLKANASLKSMGIYELPLPPALHGYQAGLDLDE